MVHGLITEECDDIVSLNVVQVVIANITRDKPSHFLIKTVRNQSYEAL